MSVSQDTLARRASFRAQPWILLPAIIAAVAAILVLMPLAPGMPVSGLDASWQYAVNQAVAQHLVFGRNFIWTIGPFGAAYTHLYDPATDAIMLAGSALIALGLCVGLAALAWPRRLFLLLFLPLAAAELFLRDAVLLTVPVLLPLVTYRLSSPPRSRNHLPLNPISSACIGILSCAVGILPLVKGTLVVLGLVEIGLAFLLALTARRTTVALSIIGLAVVSLIVGWMAAGQPVAALPHYFWSEVPIITGYSGAMSFHGPFLQVWYCLVPMAAIVAMFGADIGLRRIRNWLALLGFAFYLFVVFKEGFVRQDVHVTIAAQAFLFIALFMPAVLRPAPAILAAVVACAAWWFLETSMTGSDAFDASTAWMRIENAARGTVEGVAIRFRSPESLPAAFNRANAEIRAQSPLPKVAGTVDLYPVDLSYLFAQGMQWDGRPVIQSYSVYTRSLEQANASHLRGDDAPRTIFFAVQSIDGRLPAMEDAASWLPLLRRYSIVGAFRDYLQMHRNAEPTPIATDPSPVTIHARLNEWIDLPRTDGLVWARIDMHPTLIGRAMLEAFKLPQVQIELKLADGATIVSRYIPEIGESGFMLSPYVASTADFAMLAGAMNSGLAVRQVMLHAPEIGLWAPSVALSLQTQNIPPQPDLRRLLLIQPSQPPAVLASGNVGQVEDCTLDIVDGQLLSTVKQPVSVSPVEVSVIGWTAPSAAKGIGPDETWIALQGPDAAPRFYRAKTMARPDVQRFFRQPNMKEPGFMASLDLQGLSGDQELTIYSLHDGKPYRCGQQARLFVRSAGD